MTIYNEAPGFERIPPNPDFLPPMTIPAEGAGRGLPVFAVNALDCTVARAVHSGGEAWVTVAFFTVDPKAGLPADIGLFHALAPNDARAFATGILRAADAADGGRGKQ